MESNIPHGKLNTWCERQGLYSNDKSRYVKAEQYLRNKNLSNYERAAFFIHKLFSCEGLEFVVFSSARFDKPMTTTI